LSDDDAQAVVSSAVPAATPTTRPTGVNVGTNSCESGASFERALSDGNGSLLPGTTHRSNSFRSAQKTPATTNNPPARQLSPPSHSSSPLSTQLQRPGPPFTPTSAMPRRQARTARRSPKPSVVVWRESPCAGVARTPRADPGPSGFPAPVARSFGVR